LERISLGQLRLTAVMETGEQNLALVEEASGKGYVVKEGTYIGTEGGRITDILSEAIVVEEKYLDVFGNVAVRKKQLKLQK
jgi:type IV pilus assembly protein PilP